IEFVMELAGLHGRERLKKYPVDSLLIYDGK
ncbi:MAG: adenine phosphoribosyltransferase, partial [Lachnospiraceae bacterium]|nr:adenine phosphoribosyltransferase [Lachnospiraceae bacterium]